MGGICRQRVFVSVHSESSNFAIQVTLCAMSVVVSRDEEFVSGEDTVSFGCLLGEFLKPKSF